jgi:hypothetical protein
MALQNFLAVTKSMALALYTATVLAPLQRLYFDGPRFFYGYGFWKGAAKHDICAALTSHDSKFWLEHPIDCQAIIAKDFHSIVVLVETIGYFSLLYILVALTCRIVLTRSRSATAAVSTPNADR